MTSVKILGFLWLLISLSCVHSKSILETLEERTINNKQCSTITPMKNLSKQWAGSWYIAYEESPLLEGAPEPCLSVEIELQTSDTIGVSSIARVSPGVLVRLDGTGKFDSNPAVMEWKWTYAPQDDTTIVAETDYENYLVLLTCTPSGRIQDGTILSRDEVIPDNYLKKAKAVLAKYLDPKNNWTINNVGCKLIPRDPTEKIKTPENNFAIRHSLKQLYIKRR